MKSMQRMVKLCMLMATAAMAQRQTETTCPNGWLANEGSCYYFGHYGATFTEAESFCRQHGAHLIQVETPHENAFIKDRIREFAAKYTRWWVGITDEAIDGEWRWFNGNTLTNYTDWGPTEPQPERDEDCLVFLSALDFKWADVPCIEKNTPLCEKRGSVSQPEVIG